MIGIHSAAYSLPATTCSVADWCAGRDVPRERQRALMNNGCDRFHYAQREDLVDLGAAAVRALLERGAVDPGQVDVLVVSHTSACNVLPAPLTLAGCLRQECGLSRAYAFSVTQQQCVSALHALRVLDHLFESRPDWRTAVIANADILLAERYRAIGDAGIHSDAGSALLLTRDAASRVIGLQTYNDPRAAGSVHAGSLFENDSNYVWMLVSLARRVLKAAAVHPRHVTSVVPHNVNLSAWQQTLDALGVDQERLFRENFGRLGHAFGSDVAINLADSGALRTTGFHLVVTSGIGGCMGGFLLDTRAQ